MNMNRNFSKGLFILISLWLLGMAFHFPVSAAQNDLGGSAAQMVKIKDWQYRWGDSPFDFSGKPLWIKEESKSGENWSSSRMERNKEMASCPQDVWVRTHLPKGGWKDPALLVQIYQFFEVYTKDGLIYRYGSWKEHGPFRYQGTPPRIVSLPEKALGEPLYIRIHSDGPMIGIADEAKLGSKADIFLQLLKTDASKAFFGGFFILAGLVFLYVHLRFRSQQLFFTFSFFSIFFGIYVLVCSNLIYLFLDYPLIWAHVELISLMLGVTGLIYFVRQLFGGGKFRYMDWLCKIHSVYTVGALFLLMGNIVKIPEVLLVYQYLLIATMALVFIRVFVVAWKGNAEAKWVAIGILIVSVAGLTDIIQNMFMLQRVLPPLTYIALFLFMCVLIILLVKRIVDMMTLVKKSEKLSVAGQMAAGVAHEIRNPLFIISGFLQLLKKNPGNTSYVDVMITEVERINGIVDDFLLLSRPGDMKMESQKIEDIVEETMRLFQSNAEDIGIEIVLVKEADLPPVFCEPNQLKQVLINMIKNGMEAMSQGGRITIELTYPLKDYLQIRICDQGEGIDPEALERIGEPFYTTKENGTGLGLMVSCRIIEYHHGKLNVYSKKDEGSTFEILLPLDPGKSDPVHKKTDHASIIR
ncbi:ATP-binding protein [Paenibacillus larvae]